MKAKFLHALLAGCTAFFCIALPAAAETFPSKTLTIKVSYPAGGPTDTYVRKLQVQLQAALKQTVIIENIPGAGGAIAAQAVGKLPADGYNILATSGGDLILTPLTNASAKYNPQDFRSAGLIYLADWVLAVRPDMPVNSMDEFVEFARKAEKPLTFATWGHGSSPHLLGRKLGDLGKFKVLDIPYKGVPPSIIDLVSGQVDAAFLPLYGNNIGLIETGKIKAIGIASAKTNPNVKNLVTINNGKYIKDFVSNGWAGLFVHRDTPEKVLLQLNDAINQVVRGAEYQTYLKETGAAHFDPLSLPDTEAFYKAELKAWGDMATSLNIKPQ